MHAAWLVAAVVGLGCSGDGSDATEIAVDALHAIVLQPDDMPADFSVFDEGPQAIADAPGPPILFEHSCGDVVTPTVACPACHQPITIDNTTPRPGPGGRSVPGTQLLGQRPPANETSG